MLSDETRRARRWPRPGRWLVLLGLLALTGLVLLSWDEGRSRLLGRVRPEVARPALGAPDFSLQDLEGRTWRVSDLRGQVVLLAFFTSWCPSCREEMPRMEAAFQDYRDRGFLVLGVDLAFTETSPQDVRRFARELGLTFPIVLDDSGKVTELYQVGGIPTAVLIDRGGVIRFLRTGPVTRATLDALLAGLL